MQRFDLCKVFNLKVHSLTKKKNRKNIFLSAKINFRTFNFKKTFLKMKVLVAQQDKQKKQRSTTCTRCARRAARAARPPPPVDQEAAAQKVASEVLSLVAKGEMSRAMQRLESHGFLQYHQEVCLQSGCVENILQPVSRDVLQFPPCSSPVSLCCQRCVNPYQKSHVTK